MSKKMVLNRLTTLNQAKLELTPCHDSQVRFTEAEPTLSQLIIQFGVVSGNLTSHNLVHRLARRQSSGAVSLNEQVSFSNVSMNKEGERIQRGGDSYVVHVDGPSKVEVSSSCPVISAKFANYPRLCVCFDEIALGC